MRELKLLRKIYLSSSIPVSIVNNQYKTISCYPETDHQFLPAHFVKMLISIYKEKNIKDNLPYIQIGNYEILIGIMPLQNEEFLILGPTSNHKQDFTTFVSNFPNAISKEEAKNFYRIYKKSSNTDIVRISNIMSLIYQLQYNVELDPLTLYNSSKSYETTEDFTIPSKYSINLERVILFENKLKNAIKNGKIYELELIWQMPFPLTMDKFIITKSDVPYLFMPYLTTVSRAAIEGGADMEKVMMMHDSYIEKTRLAKNQSEIISLFMSASYDLCNLVRLTGNASYRSDLSELCEKYISENLSEKIIAQDLARICNVDRKIIFEIFKINFNCTVNEYIQKERLNRAVVLLTSSNYTIGQIASSLGYPSQGYFTKVFQKYYGCTPKQYKKARE